METRNSTLALRTHVLPVFLLFVLAATLVCAFYRQPLAGLKLDDGYIFLQYVRNIVEHGEFSFNLGEQDALGVTSFSWTLLLAAVHGLFRADLIREAQWIGSLCLGVSAAFWALTMKRLGATVLFSLLIGAVLVTDPFLIENSLAGMDSALNLLVFSTIAYRIAKTGFSGDWPTGLLLGLAFLTRPDNFFLLPAVLFAAVLPTTEATLGVQRLFRLVRPWARMVVAFSVVTVPFLVWTYLRIGSFVPSTRIGKMLVFLPLHYGITLQEFNSAGLLVRTRIAWECLSGYVAPLLTVNCQKTLVLPILLGLLAVPFLLAKDSSRRAVHGFFLAYLVCLPAFFALLFPLVKDRYLVNFHPILLTSCGLMYLYFKRGRSERGLRFPSLDASLLVLLVASFVGNVVFVHHFRGTYLAKVANVNVWAATGEWFAENLPEDRRIAVEPMGAIKFRSQDYILDMGGLVTSKTWADIAGGSGASLESIHELLIRENVDYVVDHYPNEWLGLLTQLYPEHYSLVTRIEPSPEGKAFGATDQFDIISTAWGRHERAARLRVAELTAPTSVGAPSSFGIDVDGVDRERQ